MVKGYWKLNTSLLEDSLIKARFKNLWDSLKLEISKYQNVNIWWDVFVKEKIRVFFIKEGKQVNQKRYGLIKYLECCLHSLYNEDSDKYDEIRILKNRIDNLKNEILDGVRVRNKITEQVEGEKISAHLIGRQSVTQSRQVITSLNTDDEGNGSRVVDTQDEINTYVVEFYSDLYQEKTCNSHQQQFFLSQIQENITNSDNEDLTKNVDEFEIFSTIRNMGLSKSPGIDGIPLEFYIAYWEIIKVELCEIYNTIISSLLLEDRQNMGVISLIYKGGAKEYLNSWRPISLLCVDTKILAKIIAERLKTPIVKVIHANQYCAPNKTIIDVNNNIRDIVYYSNETNVPGAIINLDWSKAFDKVDIRFLWQVMIKMGFSRDFINILMIFYSSRGSKCLVNGFLTNEFNVKRGVRQGCPLSMLLFIISQEPLYSAFENIVLIRPFRTPNCDIKLQGYADDTNLILADDQSIVEALKCVKMFELATGASLNISKTKIFGIGLWKGRTSWHIADV